MTRRNSSALPEYRLYRQCCDDIGNPGSTDCVEDARDDRATRREKLYLFKSSASFPDTCREIFHIFPLLRVLLTWKNCIVHRRCYRRLYCVFAELSASRVQQFRNVFLFDKQAPSQYSRSNETSQDSLNSAVVDKPLDVSAEEKCLRSRRAIPFLAIDLSVDSIKRNRMRDKRRKKKEAEREGRGEMRQRASSKTTIWTRDAPTFPPPAGY